MKKLFSFALALAMLFALVACGSQPANPAAESSPEAEDTTGPIVIGQTRMAAALNPLEGSNGWSLTSHGITESVYKQAADGSLTSRFVKTAEQTDDHNWALTLNEDAYFSDGSKVDAEAFCKAINTLMEKNEMCSVGAAGLMTATATGDYSVNIETENVTRILQCNLAEYTTVMFKDNGDGKFIFTGPYVPTNFEADVKIEMTPNQYYPDDEKRSDITLMKFGDASAMKLAFESGEIDMAATITADVVKMLNDEGLKTETFDAGYQYFIYCNTNRELVSDLAIRQAVNLSINRDDMITALKGGRVAGGMFANYYSFAGGIELKTDLDEAKKILDDDGWTVGTDGIREKNGKKLELKFITYASRPDLPTLMQIAVSQLEEVGIACTTEIVDNITEAMKGGDFDLAFYAQHTAPTGDAAYVLRMFFMPGSSSNYFNYDNPEVTALIKQLGELPLGEERDELARQIQALIYKDLPVIWVIDPQWHIAISDRLEGYKPYCGDYYTINETLGLN